MGLAIQSSSCRVVHGHGQRLSLSLSLLAILAGLWGLLVKARVPAVGRLTFDRYQRHQLEYQWLWPDSVEAAP